ncbi:nuclear transport factor 2 family protein [Streptomyces sp. NBC_01012]|uniref:nuclear transport factor 2 family protein n=1 Tax=Streptomyces sp. NBC_01012 TaxID=2903717 RepID=UPI00386D1862|nr:nuclear transport factor 2 family protein [Streptomyces sp. NBC_01012]
MTAFEVEQIAERIHRYYALVDDGDVQGVVGLFARRAVYERPGYDPIVGRDGLDAFYRGQRVIDRGCHTVVKLVVGAHDAAVEGGFRGTLKDGSEVELRFADFFRLDDDLLFEVRNTYFFSPMV